MFDAANLQQFDAVCLVSTTGNIFDTEERRKNIIDFVQGGKGIVGIHAATDSNYDWPQYVEMMGGWFDGHPWNAGDTVSMRVEDTKSPLTAGFTEPRFDIKDEIYQFREYSRSKQRVLLGLDMAKTPHRNGMKRADNDYPVSWAKELRPGPRLLLVAGTSRRHLLEPAGAASLSGGHPVRDGRSQSRNSLAAAAASSSGPSY
jgi:type 1 glutamine amidotransferase